MGVGEYEGKELVSLRIRMHGDGKYDGWLVGLRRLEHLDVVVVVDVVCLVKDEEMDCFGCNWLVVERQQN